MPVNIMNTENFASLRKDAGYYVDKTGFIEAFLKNPSNADRFRVPSDVTLFTRPRRFGKTLFMSMLAEFFDIDRKSRELFAGLRVARNEALCREWMNQYPVIFLTLKGIEKPTFERALARIHVPIRTFCSQHKYLLSSDRVSDEDKDSIRQYLGSKTDEDTLELALQVLTRALSCHNGKQTIVLIDEYDVPVAKAAGRGYYDKMLVFMRGFLTNALKSNPYLKFAILTGVLRITQQSLFRDLNNLQCFDIGTAAYSDVFGFTQDELDQLLSEAGLEDKRETLKAWYDGYHFGDRSDIYCPWSIMLYLAELQRNPREAPRAYWAGVSENELTKAFPGRIPSTVQDDIASLTDGKSIAVEINENLNDDQPYTEEDSFWTLLYLTGYLTPSPDSANCVVSPGPEQTVLAIPNREVREVFEKEIKSWFRPMLPRDRQQDFFDLFWKGDALNLEKTLGTMLLASSSVCDYKYREHFYHSLLLGLFLLMYQVTSNREAGEGFFDLTVLDTRNMRAAVIEVKRADSGEELEADVEKALQQIEERQYDADIKAQGYTQILHWGMAFFKKACKMGVRCE